MSTLESTSRVIIAERPPVHGLAWGLLGVIIFSLTLPFTHVAVRTLDPVFVGAGRAVVAGVLAAVLLGITRSSWLTRHQVGSALVVAAGVVIGFPLLTSVALRDVPASHGAVVIGILPAATAVVAVLRGRESPSPTFWMASFAGAASVLGFVLIGGGATGVAGADVLLLLAVVAAAIGYAEGGLLARQIGAWRTICWALVLALPVMVPLTIGSVLANPVTADASGWLAFGYVSLFSMFLGFFAWYRGLAIGPIASVSQIQLAQGVFTLAWAAAFFGDALTVATAAGAACVVLFAFLAVTARVQR